ncbi:MAG: RagB/SusD family nutrient uptake outer membrane protein, partial [Bacteroides sp.]|nr:RagB/SusD family nutrient uptake outer membrane protein [Bacteroides sp.]
SKASYPKNSDGFLIIETSRKWTDKNYLLPLPSDQLRLNPNLKQNPGWEN